MLASMEDRCQTDRVTKPTRAGLRRCRWRQPTDEESPTRGLPRRMLCHYGCQSLLTLFTFKLCCLVHAIHYGRSPAYLMETVRSVGTSRSRSGLRSSSTSSMDYSVPRLRTKFGERAFSHAGPATWNALPDHIRTVADPVKFRKLLKSLYFSQAFDIC